MNITPALTQVGYSEVLIKMAVVRVFAFIAVDNLFARPFIFRVIFDDLFDDLDRPVPGLIFTVIGIEVAKQFSSPGPRSGFFRFF